MNIYVVFEHNRDNTFFVGVFDSYKKAYYIIDRLKKSKSEFSDSHYIVRKMFKNSVISLYENILIH